jgi:hypothetical protein
MSALVYPALPGLTSDVVRTEEFATDVFETVSGKEQRTTWWTLPRFHYALKYEVTRTAVAAPAPFGAYSEIGVLLYFLDTHYGSFDSFLYDDPYDATQRRVRFKEDTMKITQIVPGHWEVAFELIQVK